MDGRMVDGKARLAASFGAQAAAYAEHRPTYPDVAVRWALRPVAGADADLRGLRVLDLAAGTGKLAEVVERTGADVVAVEPDQAMLAELRRLLPGVLALEGRAEAIPAPDNAFDAVLVGQAFHWFDTAPALAEIARVLRPGGVVAGLWNFDDERSAWVAGLHQISENPASIERWREDSTLVDHEAYDDVARREFGSMRRLTSDALVATVATHSHVLVMAEDDRAYLLARVRGYLRAHPVTAAGEFDLPIVTGVTRARLRPVGGEPASA
jgi:SAM-dependent methyltransferase